jgi:hypothetical protein|tara:strand:+ start:387 stop:620 length:234 start_codon:yes stop_codon:yes gene_type:complete
MGVEGAPEGPEDPIAQICITVGKVRRLIQKNTRIDFKRREVFFFFSLSFSLSRNHPPPPKTKSLFLFLFFFFFSPAE